MPFVAKALMARDEPVPDHKYRLWGNGVQLPTWDDYFGVRRPSRGGV